MVIQLGELTKSGEGFWGGRVWRFVYLKSSKTTGFGDKHNSRFDVWETKSNAQTATIFGNTSLMKT